MSRKGINSWVKARLNGRISPPPAAVLGREITTQIHRKTALKGRRRSHLQRSILGEDHLSSPWSFHIPSRGPGTFSSFIAKSCFLYVMTCILFADFLVPFLFFFLCFRIDWWFLLGFGVFCLNNDESSVGLMSRLLYGWVLVEGKWLKVPNFEWYLFRFFQTSHGLSVLSFWFSFSFLLACISWFSLVWEMGWNFWFSFLHVWIASSRFLTALVHYTW